MAPDADDATRVDSTGTGTATDGEGDGQARVCEVSSGAALSTCGESDVGIQERYQATR